MDCSAYTLGQADSYDKALASGPVEKVGQRGPGFFDEFPDGYPGGWVFYGLDAAKTAAREHGFSVYSLGGTFTASRRDDGELHLNNDAAVLGKVS